MSKYLLRSERDRRREGKQDAIELPWRSEHVVELAGCILCWRIFVQIDFRLPHTGGFSIQTDTIALFPVGLDSIFALFLCPLPEHLPVTLVVE